jgi:hypothetical protein
MQIPEIKRLVETYSVEQLLKAEEQLLEGEELGIEVQGKDEGEILTHILASVWILNGMKDNGNDLRTALRNYSVKVRKSIS